MELFDYLMAKKGHNASARGDLFSYLLGKKASGGSGTYTTFSGTSLNISNTIKAAIKKFMLNSTELTQDGTPTPDNPVDVNVITGSNNINITNTRNLLDFNNVTVGKLGTYGTVTVENNEIKFTATGQQVYGVQINLSGLNLKNNTTYTVANLFSITTSQNPSGWRYYNGSSYSVLNNYREYFTFTTTESGVNQLLYYIGSPATFNGTLTLSDIQLLEGEILQSDIPTYIPYSQKLEQNYPITLSSKNLFNINGDVNTRYNGQIGNYNSVENNNLTTTYSTNNGYPYGQRIYVGARKKVTISGIVSDINSTGSKSALIMCFNDNTATGVQSVAFDDTEINTRKSFTFTAETNYIIVAFAGRYNGFVSATFTNIQVEYGETATKYLPYIANPLEYCKIGDYADQIFKNTIDSEFYDSTLELNEWYLKKNIEKRIFDGSDDEVYEKIYGSIYNHKCLFYLKNVTHNNSNYQLMKSNRFVATQGASEYYPEGINVTYRTNDLVLILNDDRISEYSNEALKTFFQNNNTDVYYVLETQQYIHISETDYPILRSQLENLYNNAKSYNGQTNITQTNDGLPFNISVDVKVLDTNLNMSNSLNSSLLSNNLQNEEETSLGNTNETDEIEEPIEEYEEL